MERVVGCLCAHHWSDPLVVKRARTREVARVAHGYAGPEQPLARASAVDIDRDLLVHRSAQLCVRHGPLHQACQHLRMHAH